MYSYVLLGLEVLGGSNLVLGLNRMPSPTRKNTSKKVSSAQKKAIMNSLRKFNSTVRQRFNAGNPPSEKAMSAALKLLTKRGGTRRLQRR
jgi:hypothetical protein